MTETERTPEEVDANVKKILAEAGKFAAEQRKAEAEALNAEYNAALARISRDQAERQERIILAANHHHHVYDFTDKVGDESVDACLAQLAIWDRQDHECPMDIVMNSPGGSVIAGMHLFDQIMSYSKRPWDTSARPKGTHETTMTVRGYAASMAGILLQAVDNRIMGPEASLLIHEVSTFAGGKLGELKDEVKWLDRVSERVANIFVIRSGGKTTLEAFKAGWNRTDWWHDSESALERGFIDRIG